MPVLIVVESISRLITVEVGHGFFDQRQLEGRIGLGFEQIVAQHGLVEIGGHLGHENRVIGERIRLVKVDVRGKQYTPPEVSAMILQDLKKTAEGRYTGDPLEVALLDAAKSGGISPEEVHASYRLKREFSFDNQRKMMSALFLQGNEAFVYGDEVEDSEEVDLSELEPKDREEE